MQIKWSTLKSRAKCYLDFTTRNTDAAVYALMAGISDINKGQLPDWRGNMKVMESMAISMINNWDIRQACGLIRAFPGIVPKKYANVVPEIYIDNDLNEWVLGFNTG